MKQPIETDFDVQNHDAGVDVTFRPTESQYSFVLLADRRSLSRELVCDMARHDRLPKCCGFDIAGGIIASIDCCYQEFS